MAEALLACEDLRIDRLGAPEIDGLTCASTGNHVFVVGAPESLLRAVAGQITPARGKISIFGNSPRALLERAELACVIFTSPLESNLTVFDLLLASSELAGTPRSKRESLAKDAIKRMKLEAHQTTKLAKATGLVRRATHLAAALAAGAETLVMSDPWADLAEDVARGFSRTVAQALDDKSYLIWKGSVKHNDPMVPYADEAMVVAKDKIVAQGPPEEVATSEHTYLLRVEGDGTKTFLAVIRARGVTVAEIGPAYFRVHLPEDLKTHQIFALAHEAKALVMELSPISRGFD